MGGQADRHGVRKLVYCDAAIKTCLRMKVLCGIALSQTTVSWKVSCDLLDLTGRCQISARYHAARSYSPYRVSEGPLHPLLDSTEIKVEGESEFTRSHIGDARMLPELLKQIPRVQAIGRVTADGAYNARKCYDASDDRGANAVVPTHKNSKPWKTDTAGAIARNEALLASKYLCRALSRKQNGYHIRNRAETKVR